MMQDDRRAIYRVPPGRAEAMQALIQDAHHRGASPQVIDINARGFGAAFRAGDAPSLGLGDRARIRFTASSLAEPLEVESTVVASAERDGQRHLGFKFDTGKLPQASYRLFNRRSLYRATLEDDTHADVQAWPTGAPELRLRISDISLAGVGASVDAATNDPLADLETVALNFRLPQLPRLFRYAATVRSRQRHEGSINYALTFDRRRTDHFLDQAEDLAEFVLDRYLQEIQATEH